MHLSFLSFITIEQNRERVLEKLKKKTFFLCSLSGWGKLYIWWIWHTCKVSQPVVNTFDYRQLLGWGLGIWNGSWERPGYHSSCISRGRANNQRWQPYTVSIGNCGYLILNTCARRRRRDEHDVKIKSNKVSIVWAHSQGSFPLMNPSIPTLSRSCCVRKFNSYWLFAWVWKPGNLHVNCR